MEQLEKDVLKQLSLTISKMNDSQKQFFIGYAQGMAAAIINEKTDSENKDKE